MPVPEAPMNENGSFEPRDVDIRFPREALVVNGISDSRSIESLANQNLDGCVFRPHSAHQGAFFG